MAVKNSGKSSEERFEAFWTNQGKAAFMERRVDLAHVRGLNPGIKGIKLPSQPSDYMITYKGKTAYCEVKSCSNKTSFPFSQIETGQWTAMVRTLAAGGQYLFFLHNLETDFWYCVPGQFIKETHDGGKHSVKWAAMDEFRCTIP